MNADARVFVDGNNVMGSRPDGWWRDRSAAAQRLIVDLTPLARASDSGWTVVFDGSPPDDTPPSADALIVEYAAHDSADAADDRIIELLGALPPGTDSLVYTSDRRLRERALALGARVEGASALLRAVAESGVKETASWGEFETASPEMARLARGLFDETWLVLLGTIRRDDFPRISPVEPLLFAGELYLGMMWQPRKAQDLQRDPRCTVMNAVHDRMVRDGEFKLTGIAAEVTDTTERQAYAVALHEHLGITVQDIGPYHLFKVGITTASSPKIENDEWFRLFWRAQD